MNLDNLDLEAEYCCEIVINIDVLCVLFVLNFKHLIYDPERFIKKKKKKKQEKKHYLGHIS